MASLVSLLTQVLSQSNVQGTTAVRVAPSSTNPYSRNPFVNYNGNTYSNTYAKNNPVRGGYLPDIITESKI